MSMHIKSPTGTPDIPIHSVHVKCDYPVIFLKSIKTLGNSVIPTDIVPAYTWTVAIDMTIGNALSEDNGWVLGCTNFDSYGNRTGLYGVGIARSDAAMTVCCGSDWNTTPTAIILPSSSDLSRNTLYCRRGRCSFGFQSTSNSPTADMSDIAMSMAFCGYGIKNNSGENFVPKGAREITIYGVKLYDGNGVMIHNLIPAQSKATGRGGLYDIITGTFYPSSTDFDDVVKEALA